MRIIAGTARSLPLKTVEGMDTRPTTDKIKETLFNVLQAEVPGAYFLDLFAGSGQIGLEALSRGAAYCVFIENNRKAAKCIEDNIAFTKFDKESRLLVSDVSSGLHTLEGRYTFDLIFLDPPYRTGLLQQALPLTAALMNDGGLIIAEHPQDEEVPEAAGDFVRGREYRYGKILLTVYHHKDVEV